MCHKPGRRIMGIPFFIMAWFVTNSNQKRRGTVKNSFQSCFSMILETICWSFSNLRGKHQTLFIPGWSHTIMFLCLLHVQVPKIECVYGTKQKPRGTTFSIRLLPAVDRFLTITSHSSLHLPHNLGYQTFTFIYLFPFFLVFSEQH